MIGGSLLASGQTFRDDKNLGFHERAKMLVSQLTLEEKVKQINPQCSVTKMMLSPIIGAHTGPGMCAVVHFGRR